MKFALVLLAVVGLASAIPTKIHTRGQVQTYTLRDDLNDYLALLPIEKLIALHEKAKQDPESLAIRNRVVAYMHSEEFAKIAHIVAHNEQIQDLVNYVEGEGLRIIELLNILADRLGLSQWPTSFNTYTSTSFSGTPRSFQNILDEFIALMPIEDIIALTLDKLANSESFQNLYMKIASLDGQKLHDDALSHPEIVSLVERLNNLGVNTKKIWGVLQTIFGWGSYSARYATTYTLRDDLNDYLALIPVDKLKAIYEEAMQDPENAAIHDRVKAYLHGEEFATIAHIVAHNDQIQDLVNYLENEGLHVKELLNKLADRLGLPHWPATRFTSSSSISAYSLDEVLGKVIAVLPIEDLVALTLDKLANSESFQNLYMKIASMDGQKLHDDALSHPEIVSLVERLNKLGVDTKKIWGLLQTIFGWGSYSARYATTYTLRDDLNDYLALIPVDKLKAIYEEAMQDPENAAIHDRIKAYLHSEEFAAIAHIVAHNDQIQDLVNYLENEGLHVKELLNKLADRLGLPHWPARFTYSSSISAYSFDEVLDKVIAVLPIEDLIALTLDKLANSESFQNLYMKIASMDGQKLHDDALSHPEIVSLVARLNKLGVDTKKIWGLLQTIFGWGGYNARYATTYTLRDDLNDYLALLPIEKLIALHEKAKQDPESLAIRNGVVAYMHSEEFAKIAHIVAHNEQIQDLVNYIEGEGLRIIELLNILADRLGLPQWPTSFSAYSRTSLRGTSSSRSFQNILDEFVELMPVEDIIALTLDKLANSESFQNLYMKIASLDGQKLHDDALSHPEIVSLVERLNNLGVDTKKVWGVLKTIFGW